MHFLQFLASLNPKRKLLHCEMKERGRKNSPGIWILKTSLEPKIKRGHTLDGWAELECGRSVGDELWVEGICGP